MANPFDALMKLLGLDRPKPGADFYDRAEEARRVPDAELAVAEAALHGGGPVAERVIRQLREATTAWRDRSASGGYELRVAILEGLAIAAVPPSGWQTDWMDVRAIDPPRDLRLRIDIGAHGFASLHGQATDGQRWPGDWRIDDASLARVSAGAPWLSLPTPEELAAARTAAIETIEAWLGEGRIAGLRNHPVVARPPASEASIALLAAEQGVHLPAAYVELLQRADGIDIGNLRLLGTADAYRFDVPGSPRLVITPPDEDGAIVLAEDGAVTWIEIGDPTGPGHELGPTLRAWLRTRLEPGRRSPMRRC